MFDSKPLAARDLAGSSPLGAHGIRHCLIGGVISIHDETDDSTAKCPWPASGQSAVLGRMPWSSRATAFQARRIKCGRTSNSSQEIQLYAPDGENLAAR